MRRVRFIDGLVDEIETLGYGYHDPHARHLRPRQLTAQRRAAITYR